MGSKIGAAPNGAKSVMDGTEKFPITGSQYVTGATVAAYAKGPVIQSLSGAGIPSDAAGQLGFGGTAPTGTDHTAALNTAIANLATNSTGVTVIWDIAVGVSAPILVPSYTTLSAQNPNCGAILRVNSLCPLIKNSYTDSTTNKQNSFGKQDPAHSGDMRYRVFDRAFVNNIGIAIQGGTWNPNGNAQSGPIFSATYGFNSGIQMWGVSGLILRDLVVLKKQGFSQHILNAENVFIQNLVNDDSNLAASTSTDGIHFNGPCQDIVVKDYYAHTGSDPMAFNADDSPDAAINSTFGVSTCQHGVNWACAGNIYRVSWDNVNMLYGDQGAETSVACAGAAVRYASSVHFMTNMRGRGLTGNIHDAGIIVGSISAAIGGSLISGSGNIGIVEFEDCEHDLLTNFANSGPACFNLCGNIAQFSIRNRKRDNAAGNFPDILIGNPVDGAAGQTIQQLTVEGSYYEDAGGSNFAVPVLQIGGGVNLVEMNVKSSRVSGNAIVNAPVIRTVTGAIAPLVKITVDMARSTNVVDHTAGTLTRVMIDGVHTDTGTGTPIAIATGLTLTDASCGNLASSTALKSGSGTITNSLGPATGWTG